MPIVHCHRVLFSIGWKTTDKLPIFLFTTTRTERKRVIKIKRRFIIIDGPITTLEREYLERLRSDRRIQPTRESSRENKELIREINWRTISEKNILECPKL